jgi:hypothetical protein
MLDRRAAPCAFGGVPWCRRSQRDHLSRAWVRVEHHPWMQRGSVFFVLRYIPVDSGCINIVTQDRGTRVPPVKSFSVCCRQRSPIGISESEIAFLTGSGAGLEADLDSKLELDLMLELDLKLDKGPYLESTRCFGLALSFEYALFSHWI